MTDEHKKTLTELCWFFGPSLALFALLLVAVVQYESRLEVERKEVQEAKAGWRRSVEQQEGGAASLRVCSERLETAVGMLSTADGSFAGQDGLYRTPANRVMLACNGRMVREWTGPVPSAEELKKMKPRLCP